MFVFINEKGLESKVTFAHERKRFTFTTKSGKTGFHMKPIYTTCHIYTGDEINGKGIANCHPNDNFSYKEGRKIALQRALEVANIPTDVRKVVWNTYFESLKVK